MSIDFAMPGRGNGSNLSVSMSPLGIVELSDEEFEVNGPRLNRYATHWAMYLGRHWSAMREAGEPQITFNYFSAFTDYLNTFTFGRGFHVETPPETEAIVPPLLKRVWETDNNREDVLYEMGQQGGVTGDCFIKVAYQESFTNPITGVFQPGRVRILPLTSAHCFPEWHPHDREEFIRFKLKYKFWGTAPEGTRQVYTYTEILEPDRIQEFVNDECISDRPNPLGVIPIVHIANKRVSGSPWGLPDCYDIVSVNRTYNEMMTTGADILNYHAAPITIITGAKANNLEKGAKKIWAIPNKDATVSNLEIAGGADKLLEYVQALKIYMHEATGVPETALGQAQPISNTSGVALSIQFQPLMMKFRAKTVQYAGGLVQINKLIMLTLVIKEPESLFWNESYDVPLKTGQLNKLNRQDPITYQTEIHFPPPLPIDKVVLLNEIGQQMAFNLESRRGALRALGEEFPDAKLEEIRNELMEDAKADGALKLLQTQITKEIVELTGMIPGEDGASAGMPPLDDSGMGTDANGNPTGSPEPQMPQPIEDVTDVLEANNEYEIRKQLVMSAFGPQAPLRQTPKTGPNGEEV